MTAPPATANAPLHPFIRAVARNWSVIVSGVLLLYAGLPWLGPLLRHWGYERAGLAIFRMYSGLCHQIAARSFTFYGYQVCYCHRCTALYTTLFGLSALFALWRWRRTVGRWVAFALTLPMAIDGTWHALDDALPMALRSSDAAVGSPNFWLRMITGALFALGVVLWAYPRLQREVHTI